MTGQMTGKVALITGGSRGIGRGIAARFRREGAHVVITARKREQLEAAAAALRSEIPGPGEVVPVVAHAGEPEAAQSCVTSTVERFGALDVLVNNAATNPYMGDLIGIDLPRALKTTQVNQWAMVAWARAAWDASMREGGGVIVNIASVGGMIVDPGIGWYNATKAAMLLMTRQLAYELGPKVRVNAIAPGLISTELAAEVVQARAEILEKQLPLRRLGTVDDVASAAVFLATDQSSWMTGQSIVLDGGALALPIAVEP